MNAKADNSFFEATVTEALAKMKEATTNASSYQVHRSSGAWAVRRECRTLEKGRGDKLSDYALVTDLKPAADAVAKLNDI